LSGASAGEWLHLHPTPVNLQGLLRLQVGKNPHRLLQPRGPVARQVALYFAQIDDITPEHLLTRPDESRYPSPLFVRDRRPMGPLQPDPILDPRGLQSFEKPQIAELPVENQRLVTQKIFHLSEQPRMLQIAEDDRLLPASSTHRT